LDLSDSGFWSDGLDALDAHLVEAEELAAKVTLSPGSVS
jgi:hypothetical protein